MTLIGRMLERRGLENPQQPLTATAIADWLGTDTRTDSGIAVTPTSSMGMAAVWRSVSLIGGVSASLPFKAYRRGDERTEVEKRILWDPHPEMTGFEFWRLTYVHRCLWGNHYALKNRNGGGVITELHPLDPSRMQVARARRWASELNPTGKVFAYVDDTGEQHALTPYDVLHLPGLGYDGVTGVSPIRMARQAIALALAAESYGGRLFGQGSLMTGVLQTEQRLAAEEAERLKMRWKARMAGLSSAHDVAILDAGAKFQSLTMPNSDAQFLESRSFQTREIERFFGVPPFLMMDTENSTSWGTGLEQQATAWVKFDLYPTWLAPTEGRATKELLLDPNVYAEFSIEGLLRGDSMARATFYRVMREVGALSANDIRRLENRPPVPEGDTYLQPLNLAPLGYDPTGVAK
jgi:HK97 family phage portal protein